MEAEATAITRRPSAMNAGVASLLALAVLVSLPAGAWGQAQAALSQQTRADLVGPRASETVKTEEAESQDERPGVDRGETRSHRRSSQSVSQASSTRRVVELWVELGDLALPPPSTSMR